MRVERKLVVCGSCANQTGVPEKGRYGLRYYCWYLGRDDDAPDDLPCHAVTPAGKARYDAAEEVQTHINQGS